jgi:hypothetical protein
MDKRLLRNPPSVKQFERTSGFYTIHHLLSNLNGQAAFAQSTYLLSNLSGQAALAINLSVGILSQLPQQSVSHQSTHQFLKIIQ